MSNFQVKNEEVEKLLNNIGHVLKDVMPEGWGFTVMMFDMDTTTGSMFYLSSAQRADMIEAMKEFIKKNEDGEV